MREQINPTDLARNHWTYILTQLDVKPESLTGKHTACPHCGGEDRFRFDNKEGAGTFYCSGCGAGTGYALIMKLKGIDFPDAVKLVEGMITPDVPVDERDAPPSLTEKKASLNRLWKGGRLYAEETVLYLVGRGLSEKIAIMAAGVMRFTQQAWLRDDKSFHPAMLALVMSPEGEPVSIHRTFLLPEGRVKKMMPCVGSLHGAGVWFGDRRATKWVVGEGIETTLAGLQMEGMEGTTAVAALNANGMEALEIPDHVTDLVILADNDASFTGLRAASVLAHKVSRRRAPCEIVIATPAFTDKDMLDALDISASGPIYYFAGGRHEQEPSCVAGDREPKARPVGQRKRIHRTVCAAGS